MDCFVDGRLQPVVKFERSARRFCGSGEVLFKASLSDSDILLGLAQPIGVERCLLCDRRRGVEGRSELVVLLINARGDLLTVVSSTNRELERLVDSLIDAIDVAIDISEAVSRLLEECGQRVDVRAYGLDSFVGATKLVLRPGRSCLRCVGAIDSLAKFVDLPASSVDLLADGLVVFIEPLIGGPFALV